MMKRLMLLVGVFAAVTAGRACVPPTGIAVLVAQSVPYNSTFSWTPNPASENVTSYTAQLDTGALVVVQPSACTATACQASLPIPTFGPHVAKVFATNTNLSGANTVGSPQNGPVAAVPFVLNQAASAPSGGTIR